MDECTIIRPGGSFSGRQGLDYGAGISAESAGARAISMVRLTLPPGARARAPQHQSPQSAIYGISGRGELCCGPQLEHHVVLEAGDFLHIPAGVPHLPANTSSEVAEAVLSRTDPNEQESVVTLPELDLLPHLPPLPDPARD